MTHRMTLTCKRPSGQLFGVTLDVSDLAPDDAEKALGDTVAHLILHRKPGAVVHYTGPYAVNEPSEAEGVRP